MLPSAPLSHHSHSTSDDWQRQWISPEGRNFLQSVYSTIDKLKGPARLAAQIQLRTGARAREVLDLKYSDLSQEGYIYVESKKRGRARVCFVGDLLENLPKRPEAQSRRVFRSLTYWKYRRHILSVRSRFPKTRSGRNQSTHFLRTAAAVIAYAASHGSADAASEYLGHKSLSSIRHYLKPTGGLHGDHSSRRT